MRDQPSQIKSRNIQLVPVFYLRAILRHSLWVMGLFPILKVGLSRKEGTVVLDVHRE